MEASSRWIYLALYQEGKLVKKLGSGILYSPKSYKAMNSLLRDLCIILDNHYQSTDGSYFGLEIEERYPLD
jgi:hypothetical protein